MSAGFKPRLLGIQINIKDEKKMFQTADLWLPYDRNVNEYHFLGKKTEHSLTQTDVNIGSKHTSNSDHLQILSYLVVKYINIPRQRETD